MFGATLLYLYHPIFLSFIFKTEPVDNPVSTAPATQTSPAAESTAPAGQSHKSGRETAKLMAVLDTILDSSFEVYLKGSAGSGFTLVNGIVVTNKHVAKAVGNSIKLKNFASGETCHGTVEYVAANRDVAFIKTDCTAPPLKYSQANVEDEVILVGNPLAKGLNISRGKVTDLNAPVRTEINSWEGIQHTANSNSGNSGGPLLNLKGEVIGMHSASSGDRRLGFAVRTTDIVAEYRTYRPN